MHKYVRLNKAARVCVCVRADVCAVCSFVDARRVCGTFDMSRDFVTTSCPPRQKHKQQQHPRHHSPATDGTRPPLVRDGNTPARVVSAPAVTLRISEPSRLLSEFLSLSLARARAHTFSLSPLAVSLRWVSFFLFFPAQHTDCEDHPKVIQSCERVHRPTVRTSSRHPNNANNPNNDGNNSNSNNTPPVRTVYARMRPL